MSRARRRIARAAMVSYVMTALSRLVRGPARPTWSFRVEALVGTLRRFLRAMAVRPAPELRAAFDELSFRPVRGVARERVSAGGVDAEWLTPADLGEGARVLLYFHGGAYVWGSSATHAELVSRVARAAQVRALVPNYRLAPEHPHPAAHRDALAVYRWLLERGVRAEDVVMGGDSAGGNLTLVTALSLGREGLPPPSGLALLCPWVDLGGKGGSLEAHRRSDWIDSAAVGPWVRTYFPSGSLADPRASPLYAELRGLPPTLVQVGGAEVLRDQIAELGRRLERAGVPLRFSEYTDMFHVWQMYVGLFPELRAAIDELAAFVRDPRGRAGQAHQRGVGAGAAGLANR